MPQAEDQWSALERWAITRLEHGVTVADMAEHLGMERSALTRRYRRERGMTPGQYLRDCRMMRACRLLRESTQSLRHIAALCGYRSRAAFHAAFMQSMGTAPQQWRQQERQSWQGAARSDSSEPLSTFGKCVPNNPTPAVDGAHIRLVYDRGYGRNGHPYCSSSAPIRVQSSWLLVVRILRSVMWSTTLSPPGIFLHP